MRVAGAGADIIGYVVWLIISQGSTDIALPRLSLPNDKKDDNIVCCKAMAFSWILIQISLSSRGIWKLSHSLSHCYFRHIGIDTVSHSINNMSDFAAGRPS